MTVRAHLEHDQLVVEIDGITDQFLCMSRGLTVARSEIADARIVDWSQAKSELGWRVAGGYFPGYFATGWFAVPGRRGARQFLAVFRDREQLLRIETTKAKPARFVLAVDNAAELVAQLSARPTVT